MDADLSSQDPGRGSVDPSPPSLARPNGKCALCGRWTYADGAGRPWNRCLKCGGAAHTACVTQHAPVRARSGF
jgi:hypothetical protein